MIDGLLGRLRTRLAELEEAKRLLESSMSRRVYRMFGDRIMVELSLDEARRYIEDEMESIGLQLKRLEEEREKLVKELRELERKLKLY
jgi:chaperonin cofactor prefoldin